MLFTRLAVWNYIERKQHQHFKGRRYESRKFPEVLERKGDGSGDIEEDAIGNLHSFVQGKWASRELL